jgi:hypothetical protein
MNKALVIDHDINAIGSCPDDDPAGTHVPGCPCRAGGDAEYVTLRLNAMRCVVCGHRLDDMDGCDSCAADREAALVEALTDEGDDCG